MPARVWVLSGLIVGVAAAALIVFFVANPRQQPADAEPIVVASAGEETPAADASDAVVVDPAVADAEARMLAADLSALAAERQAALPPVHMPVLGGPTVLYLVTAAENQLTFTYEIEIDVQDYRLPADPTELYPALEARNCAGAGEPRTCYGFTPAFAATVCADPVLRPLIDRGAVVRYLFRDLNRRPLTSTSVATANCAA